MIKMIDFTSCRQIPGRAYNGANGKKIAVEYNGAPYMLKFPPSGAGKPTDLSYTNSCFSEHIASSIFNMLGVTAQETMLGTFNVGGKAKVVCACRDFTVDGKLLHDFCSIKNTVLDSDSGGNGTELFDVLDTIEKQQFVDPVRLTAFFWDMFVIDAMLGNFDRHNGNWGFLSDAVSGETEIAPVFDCGSCLLPQADERVMRDALTNKDAMNARVFQFPTSTLRQDGLKINYYDFLIKAVYTDCNAALKRIYGRMDMKRIRTFIDSVPYSSDLQKEFYDRYIATRFDMIIRPAYEIAMSDEPDKFSAVRNASGVP
ncbi:MAG: HipA domain-containing protein [Oscillospiraceae bacterium]|nr:HipA domain-containing protein [Oscillospiraceae bacterium]